MVLARVVSPALPAVLASLVSLVSLASPASSGGPPATSAAGSETVSVVVEARDAAGRPVSDLEASEVTARLGERAAPVASVGGAPGPWRIVLWFDSPLSSDEGFEAAARALTRQAEALVGLGPVEVVVADPLPEVLAGPVRESDPIREALGFLADEGAAGDLAAIRRDFLAERQQEGGGEVEPSYARELVQEESDLVAESTGDLLSWVRRQPAAGPGALFLVEDGHDLAPGAFYGVQEKGGAGRRLAALHGELARTLAARGWAVFPLALAPPPAGAKDPRAALEDLAAASAGEVVTRATRLPALLEGLAARRRWTIAVPAPAPSDAAAGPLPVELATSRAGVHLRAPRWAAPAGGAALEMASERASGTAAASSAEVPAAEEEPRATPAASPAPRGATSGRASDRASHAPPVIVLLPPRGTVTGRTRFRTLTATPEIDRVVFFLDDRKAATDDRPPFAATLDLGEKVAPHTVRVEAYSADGYRLGEHSITVNAETRPFRVAITRLDEAPGAVTVGAEVSVPPGAALDRVEIYRNTELGARLTAPPFEARLPGPEPGPEEYVRVVAYLADGTSQEDVRLLAAPGAVERVEVNLVQIFTVVTNEDGNPVEGLGRDDFTVLEKGKRRPLERFAVADDVPLVLGVLVDTSESMWPLMPDTKKAASRFLVQTLGAEDQAFLVSFDNQPRLVRQTTGDLSRLLRGFQALEAGGRTALYDSVVFSLLQFKDTHGRGALVLLTDGEDYGSRFGPKRCIDYGRELGIPIYVLSLAGLDGERRAVRKTDLESITDLTGGRIYYITDLAQLGAAYDQINAELRSQYVLAFATEQPLTPEELRSIRVKVDRKGVRVRTAVTAER